MKPVSYLISGFCLSALFIFNTCQAQSLPNKGGSTRRSAFKSPYNCFFIEGNLGFGLGIAAKGSTVNYSRVNTISTGPRLGFQFYNSAKNPGFFCLVLPQPIIAYATRNDFYIYFATPAVGLGKKILIDDISSVEFGFNLGAIIDPNQVNPQFLCPFILPRAKLIYDHLTIGMEASYFPIRYQGNVNSPTFNSYYIGFTLGSVGFLGRR